MKDGAGVSQWLADRCQKEHLSLREAAAKTGLSHTTIGQVINGTNASPQTLRKLAQAFGGNGINQRLALEDHLLVLAGYRTERPEEEFNEALAHLIDKVKEFNQPQLRMMESFADFLTEIKEAKTNEQGSHNY